MPVKILKQSWGGHPVFYAGQSGLGTYLHGVDNTTFQFFFKGENYIEYADEKFTISDVPS